MKKILHILIVAMVSFTLTNCEYDDDALWHEMEQVKDRVTTLEEVIENANNNIQALQTLIEALQKNVFVTAVTDNTNGYTINFSNGKTASITNGKDAPVVSIKQDTDQNYYWTLNGEWLLIDNQKVRANGTDGENAIAPQVKINQTSKEWEISTDNGQNWVSTGVIAEGKEGASCFKSIDTTNKEYVTITLNDETTLKLARHDESIPLFIIENAPEEVAYIEYDTTVVYSITTYNVADYIINKPTGWQVHFDETENLLSITAPKKDFCHYEKEGIVSITIVSAAGKSAIVKLNVMAGEWVEETEMRILTFEDGTEKFEPYECVFSYAMMGNEEYKWITKWSDYIPTDGQYGNGHGSYEWYDEGNTELAFVKPTISSWWGISGHAGISNYVGNDDDIAQYEDDNYLFMIDLQAYNVTGGANGSKNFCSQYGYLDPEEYATQYSPEGVLPGLQFYDNVPRVIDHMYVTNTSYAYAVITNGECDFGGSYEYNDESTFKIVAYGYDSMEDTEPTVTEFYLLNTNKRIVTDWTKWDLSVLGKVVRVEFNLVACYEGYGRYGLVIPAYFAYDDVAVRFDSKTFK